MTPKMERIIRSYRWLVVTPSGYIHCCANDRGEAEINQRRHPSSVAVRNPYFSKREERRRLSIYAEGGAE